MSTRSASASGTRHLLVGPAEMVEHGTSVGGRRSSSASFMSDSTSAVSSCARSTAAGFERRRSSARPSSTRAPRAGRRRGAPTRGRRTTGPERSRARPRPRGRSPSSTTVRSATTGLPGTAYATAPCSRAAATSVSTISRYTTRGRAALVHVVEAVNVMPTAQLVDGRMAGRAREPAPARAERGPAAGNRRSAPAGPSPTTTTRLGTPARQPLVGIAANWTEMAEAGPVTCARRRGRTASLRSTRRRGTS